MNVYEKRTFVMEPEASLADCEKVSRDLESVGWANIQEWDAGFGPDSMWTSVWIRPYEPGKEKGERE